MRYDELMKAFGAKLGGMELQPDESGCVILDVDGMPLTILDLDEFRQVALTGEIGEPPPVEKMERLYRAMLVANHNFIGTHGATISLNPETGKLSLCRLISLELTDADAFFAEAEQFVNTLETWSKLVSDFRGSEIEPEGGAEAKADATGPAPEFGAGMAGFMQV